MNKELDFLQDIFSAESETINLVSFLVKILITTILSLIISQIYIRFGNALSNRKSLSKNFVLIAITTMLIITIVKSSLALSLGLVGALSIVRFRTAIKEPEELAYFFMVISIGLGIGAGQLIITIVGTICLSLIIFILNRKQSEENSQNLILQLEQSKSFETEEILSLLKKNSTQLKLNRIDDSPNNIEISFSVQFKDITSLLTVRNLLKKKYPNIIFSFIELQ